MAQHASDSSVEDRIKRNIYNIQRTSAQLDDNFTRRWILSQPSQLSLVIVNAWET